MNIVEQLKHSGMIAQVSSEDELLRHLEDGCRSIYCGFDPTADSLHIGNLVPLLALKKFQIAGHKPILLMGGATGIIGDPSGRDSERELQSPDAVEKQMKSIRLQASAFLDFDCGQNSALIVNNLDWISGINVIDYLRDIGKHFSVNAMMQKESVRRRIVNESQGISYTEFSYMILQSYDFLVLNKKHECTIQIGGSDQWGNITAGIDLIRKAQGGSAFAITYPLITRADGTKLGKSTGGSIWLDKKKTPPFAFYQYWLNVSDEEALRYLALFTLLKKDEILKLSTEHQRNPGKRIAQKMLAAEVTTLVHGRDELRQAERITSALFESRIEALREKDLEQLSLDGLQKSFLGEDRSLISALVSAGLAQTPKGEVTIGQARKLIQGKSISVNGKKITDIEARLESSNALYGKYFLVQKGKKTHCLFVG
jgi:tyrosyl-tRNA synthetase